MSSKETKQEQLKLFETELQKKFGAFSSKIIADIKKNIDNPNLNSFIKKAFDDGNYDLIISEVLENNILDSFVLGYGGGIEFATPETLTRKLFTKSWTPDQINISKRIKRASSRVQKSVAKEIKAAIAEGNARKKIIKDVRGKIKKGQVLSDPLRKDMIELIDREDLKGIKAIRSSLNNKTKLQRAYTRVLDALESKDEVRIAKAIKNAIDKKSRYVAERIARSESARAWTEGFHLKWKDDEDVVGYRWKLSGAKRELYDVCDIYANSDFGMGKGVFPKNKTPLMPAHPNCNCYYVPVYEGDVKDFKLKNADSAVKKMSEHQKMLLMGDKNRKLYNSGKISYDKATRGFSKLDEIKTRIVENEIK